MRRIRNLTALLMAVTAFAACVLEGMPTKDGVRTAFMAQHPNYSVQSVEPGEGDSGGVYIAIKYRKPDDAPLYQEVWLYQDTGKSKWECTHKSEPLPVDAKAGSLFLYVVFADEGLA